MVPNDGGIGKNVAIGKIGESDSFSRSMLDLGPQNDYLSRVIPTPLKVWLDLSQGESGIVWLPFYNESYIHVPL